MVDNEKRLLTQTSDLLQRLINEAKYYERRNKEVYENLNAAVIALKNVIELIKKRNYKQALKGINHVKDLILATEFDKRNHLIAISLIKSFCEKLAYS
ncbi:MAG: hypothetical protein KJ767_03555 [Nanoarchaeota archaeon]|nr:hypothetical protein [Nanoarchaeota archaeon]